MVKSGLVTIVLGAMLLLVALLLWQRTTVVIPPSSSSLVASFEKTHAPSSSVDLGERYGGRLELLDPRRALPAWHRHPRAEAVRTNDATRRCVDAPRPEITDADLLKAIAFHEAGCKNGDRTAFTETAPFVHPSGKSYASL